MSGQEDIGWWAELSKWLLSWGGFLLTAGGFGISVWTLKLASSVKTMVRTIISRGNAQEDGDRLQVVITELNTAKEVAKRRKAGPSSPLNAGTKDQKDLQTIIDAHDALVTKFPLECGDKLREDANKAAKDLENAIQDIKSGNVSGWNSALATLQTLIPRLDQAERDNRNKLLAPPE